MTQFHEDQEVEVQTPAKIIDGKKIEFDAHHWCKARILWRATSCGEGNQKCYEVKFADGTRAMFDADHIRPTEMVWMP